jgi:hypothetical protein
MAGRGRNNRSVRGVKRGAISRKRVRDRGAASGKAPRPIAAEKDTKIVEPLVPEHAPATMGQPTVEKKRDELIVLQESLASALDWYMSQLTVVPSAPLPLASRERTDFHDRTLFALLQKLRDALASRSVAKGVDDFPLAPKLLLHASRDPVVLVDSRATSILCNCLLLYTRLDTTLPPAPAAATAKSWACTILAGMVTGHKPGASSTNEEMEISMSEIDSVIPACPRDVLTAAQLAQHAFRLLRTIRTWTRVIRKEFVDRCLHVLSLTAGRKVSVCVTADSETVPTLRNVCNELALILHHPEIVSLVEAAIICAGSIPWPLVANESTAQCSLPESLLRQFDSPSSSNSNFSRLNIEAQASLLRLCPQLLVAEEERAREMVSRLLPWISLQDEYEIHQTLGWAAAEDLTCHWHWIDILHEEMLSEDEPFSMRHWRSRWFNRAVHNATLHAIARLRDVTNIDGTKLLRAAPFYRRFGTRLRPLVSALEAHGRRIQPSTAGVCAVEYALATLCADDADSGPSGHVPLLLPVDAHVAILAMESQIQIIFASAAMACVEGSLDGNMRVIEKICRISVAIDSARMPGGELVEGPQAYNQRVKRACGIFDALMRFQRMESTNISEHNSEAAQYLSTWDDVDLAESLVAGIVVGAGSVVAVGRSQDDPHWTGELLRACELVQSRLSREDAQGHARVGRVFAAALSRARTLLRTTLGRTPESTSVTLDHPGLSGSLKRREEAWESRMSP